MILPIGPLITIMTAKAMNMQIMKQDGSRMGDIFRI